MMQVSKAVINGAKLAYPNGVKLKYENVSLTLSVGDGANTNTAPQGKICKIIVIIGNISNLIFFIVSGPPAGVWRVGGGGGGGGSGGGGGGW